MNYFFFPNSNFAGNTPKVETTSVGMRKSKSRANTDGTRFEHRKINQRGELVRVCSRCVFMKRDQVTFAA